MPWVDRAFKWNQYNYNASDTWIVSPSMINEFRIAYIRNFGGRVDLPQISLGDLGSKYQIQGTPSLPQIQVTGRFNLNSALAGPIAGSNQYQVRDTYAMTTQRHSLRFGGEVMKNVAGYDVSRLTVGALGTLGVILEVSLKVLPIPASEATMKLSAGADEVIRLMNEWAGKPLPVTATAYRAGSLTVRLSGAASAVSSAVRKIGGEAMDAGEAARFWSDVREHRAAFFAGDQPLWRLSVKPTTPPLDLAGPQFIEWSGALRWLRSDADAKVIRAAATQACGHATLFRAPNKTAAVFHPLSPALERIHRRLKEAFDPAGILNPGRLYPDF